MDKYEVIEPNGDGVLFDRVVSILEQARGNVVRAVNSNMVLAYWLIGREIQGGEERAEYGKQVVEDLSVQLTKKYGKGFSPSTLWRFRQLYQVYADRIGILAPLGRELVSSEIQHPPGGEFSDGFNLQVSWSHYRALMWVKDGKARDFYEREAVSQGRASVSLAGTSETLILLSKRR